jgi:hypothetical protein
MAEGDTPYSLWLAGKNRFAVCVGRNVKPVIGYLIENADGTWLVEHGGKVLPENHRLLSTAAEVLLSLKSN